MNSGLKKTEKLKQAFAVEKSSSLGFLFSSSITETFAKAGFDFIAIDMEPLQLV